MNISEETIDWYGDLDDDYCAQWRGMLLRAEWMNGGPKDKENGPIPYWWWAVSSLETGDVLDSSNYSRPSAHSGDEARNYAEAAARSWVVVKGYNKYSQLELHNKRKLKMRPL